MRSLDRSDEELTPVRSRTSIGHGQQERLVMLQVKVFVLELLAVDRDSAGPVVGCKVSSLCIIDRGSGRSKGREKEKEVRKGGQKVGLCISINIPPTQPPSSKHARLTCSMNPLITL
jgi:hypothetical protein